MTRPAARTRLGLQRALLAAAALQLSLAVPVAEAFADDGERGKPAAGKCVEVRSEAVYRGYGYTHLVHLKNGCEKRMRCTVSTDVNRVPTSVTLAPGDEQTVTTFNGSPASEFKAQVDCEEAKD